MRFIPGVRYPRHSTHVPDEFKAPDYAATDAIKTLLPNCIALVIDIYTNADDVNIISAIDRDGCDLLNDYTLGADGQALIATAMLHDVDLWLRINKMPDFKDYVPSEYRCWQWTQAHNVRPLGPISPYQYFEKV